MIIVEGPDNSGKSTLISTLSEQLKLKIINPSRKGPPKTFDDVYINTRQAFLGALSHINNRTIVDRLSLIGESIYGPICRGKDLWMDDFEKKVEMGSILRTLNPFFIYCRPPDSIVLNMDSHQIKAYDTPEHLEQVKKNRSLILRAYDNYFAFFRGYNFYQYDYTKPEKYNDLIERLKEYTKW